MSFHTLSTNFNVNKVNTAPAFIAQHLPPVLGQPHTLSSPLSTLHFSGTAHREEYALGVQVIPPPPPTAVEPNSAPTSKDFVYLGLIVATAIAFYYNGFRTGATAAINSFEDLLNESDKDDDARNDVTINDEDDSPQSSFDHHNRLRRPNDSDRFPDYPPGSQN